MEFFVAEKSKLKSLSGLTPFENVQFPIKQKINQLCLAINSPSPINRKSLTVVTSLKLCTDKINHNHVWYTQLRLDCREEKHDCNIPHIKAET